MSKKYPRKFKKLLETQVGDVQSPDYVLLNYSVCGCDKDSCGWAGWTLAEGVFKITGKNENSGTGDLPLPNDCQQICPKCGKSTFRTDATLKFDLSKSADIPSRSDWVAGVHYEVDELEYEDD